MYFGPDQRERTKGVNTPIERANSEQRQLLLLLQSLYYIDILYVTSRSSASYALNHIKISKRCNLESLSFSNFFESLAPHITYVAESSTLDSVCNFTFICRMRYILNI